jgi:hypothetical protein
MKPALFYAIPLLVMGSLTVTLGSPQNTPAVISEQGLELFEKRVRPLLIEKCQPCHGEKQQMGQLRLDSRAAMLKGGERGKVVLPNAPEKSLLIAAISYHTPSLQMPPKGRLSEMEIAVLTEWVKQGAQWTPTQNPKTTLSNEAGIDLKARAQYWSFRPIKKVTPPAVKRKEWVRNPVDAFILAKLESKGLTPAPPTDKYTLLRRVTFDLTGLPPTPKEIQDFIADTSPRAYEKVVERLLANPHYGERWARHWLDLVRYAETDGHEFDFEKPGAYQYRDYLIRALNADVPYNQFVLEHIAGDLLATPRTDPKTGRNESILATGFWWLGEGKHSPVDLRVDQAERTDNQIDVFGKAFLGLSMGCVRCHDHKFDPITQKDYYGLAGILNSTRYDLHHTATSRDLEAIQTATKQRERLEATLWFHQWRSYEERLQNLERELLQKGNKTRLTNAASPALPAGFQTLLAEAASNPLDFWYPWAVLSQAKEADFARVKQSLLSELKTRQGDASRIEKQQKVRDTFTTHYPKGWTSTGKAFGASPSPLAYEISTDSPTITSTYGGFVADSGRISNHLTGTMRSPTFKIKQPFLHYRMAGKRAGVRLVIDGFQRIRYPIYGGLQTEANSKNLKWYVQDVTKWVGHSAYIEAFDFGEGRVVLQKVAESNSPQVPVAPNRFVIEALEKANSLAELAHQYTQLVQEGWSLVTNRNFLKQYNGGEEYLQAVEWLPRVFEGTATAPVSPEIATAWREWNTASKSVAYPELLQVASDGTGEDEQIQLRGNPKTLGTVAPRQFLTVLAGEKQAPMGANSGRLQLAQRVLSPQNPLLNRVIVNRLWHYHFGTGIVKTVDDFGLRADRPTHPELLDWLATEIGKQGYSLKQMHRLFLLSNTYRMSSKVVPQIEAKDPANALLHRMPVRRMEAEVIRDSILSVSGRLDRTFFGPSVLPFLTPYMEGRGRPAKSGPLDGANRRSIYLGVRRNFLNPMFLAFDFPVPFNCMGRRNVSNVPAQALVLMNNPLIVEQARYWSERILAQPNLTPTQRIQQMYLEAFGRPALPAEIANATQFLQDQSKGYREESSTRAWQDLCHVLYNVKEFLFIP